MLRLNLMNVGVLALYVYFIFKMCRKGEMKKKVGATALVLLYVCSVEGFTNPSEKIKQATSEVEDVIKGLQKESNIDVNTVGKASTDERGGGMMGPKLPGPQSQMPYDGLCLKTGNTESWMKSPDNEPLMPNDKLYTYLGSTGPIKMRLSEQAALIGPPVDGEDGSPEKMFMFANNRSSPACCPSSYSTSTGCICTTENQRDYVAGRGGNL